jgi:DNA-binding response OmpR family regulator
VTPAANSEAAAQLRVLVVDDNVDQVHGLRYLLEDMGHVVAYAINGVVALERALEFLPDVILLDIGLPDVSGLNLARQLRRLPALKAAYILGITGLSIPSSEALAAGFDEVFTKPLDPSVLEARLEARLARLTGPKHYAQSAQ